jgi:hypothetical protein
VAHGNSALPSTAQALLRTLRRELSGRAPSVISEEVFAFLAGGKSLVVGTRDAQLVPEVARAVGLRVGPDRLHLSVFLPDAAAARTLHNLRENGRIAIAISNPPDHRSLQLKGQVTGLRPATEEDAAAVLAYVGQVSQVLDVLGLPAHLVARINCLPCTRAEVRVEEIFLQTPGPGAGSALGSRAP